MSTIFSPGDVVLFQGDSLADGSLADGGLADGGLAGGGLAGGGLAGGFPSIAGSLFAACHPEMDVVFLNRCVPGSTTGDLMDRWQEDCLDLHPDWISILIGVYDTRCCLDEGFPISSQEFAANYRGILEQVRVHTKASLILCEPFLIPSMEERMLWRSDLDEKINAVRALAREYGAIYIPFDGLFAQASCRREPGYWSGDGVHPSLAGHGLMAKAWLDAVSLP